MTKEKGLKPPTLTSRLITNVFNKEMMEKLFELYDPKKEPQVYNEECINAIKSKLVDYLTLHDPDIKQKINLEELTPFIKTIFKTVRHKVLATMLSDAYKESKKPDNEENAKKAVTKLLHEYYSTFMSSASKSQYKAEVMTALGEIVAKIEPVMTIPTKGPKWEPGAKAAKIATTKASAVEKHYVERYTVEESTLVQTRGKPSGVSEGYVGKSTSDNSQQPQEYMVKKAHKTNDEFDDPDIPGTKTDRNDSSDTRDFLCEFMSAPLYQRTLNNRTPVIAAVESTTDGTISMRSKFLPGAKTIADFTNSLRDGWWGPNAKTKLANVEGIEKLWAAYLSGGEEDIHMGNAVVMDESTTNANGQPTVKKVFGKIDLGRSGRVMFTEGEKMWENFNNRYRLYDYNNNVDFDLSKFSSALSQNAQISNEEIEKYVKSRIQILKELGFDPAGLEIRFWLDDEFPTLNSRMKPQRGIITSFDNLEQFYTEMFKNHWKAQQEFLKLVVAAEKMTDHAGNEPKPGWIRGEWIKQLNKANPIEYAIHNNLKIDGQDPMTYAVFNGIKINGKTPDEYAESQGINIGGLPPDEYHGLTDTDPVLFALYADMKVDGEDPLKYAILHGIKINGEDPTSAIEMIYENSQDPLYLIDSKSAIEYAALNGIKVEGIDPIRYSYQNKWQIAGQDPIAYAVLNNLKIEEVNGDKYSAIDYAIKHAIRIDSMLPAKYAEMHGIPTNNPVITPTLTSPSPLPLNPTPSLTSPISVSSPTSNSAPTAAKKSQTQAVSSDYMVLPSDSKPHQASSPISNSAPTMTQKAKTPAESSDSMVLPSDSKPQQASSPISNTTSVVAKKAQTLAAVKEPLTKIQASSPLSSSTPKGSAGAHTASLNKQRESLTQQPVSEHAKTAKSSGGKHTASHKHQSHAEAAKKEQETNNKQQR